MELSTAAGLANAGPGNSTGGERKKNQKTYSKTPLSQEHTAERLPGQFQKAEGAGFGMRN